MKKETLKRRSEICNSIMHYIYRYIDTNIDLNELSSEFKISKFHMLRIFKEEFNQNIYEVIKTIRLQKSSILLLTNKNSTISSIALKCGYSSHGAYNRAFKSKYNMSPKQWRNNGYQKFLNSEKIFFDIVPKIVKMGSLVIYYERYKGYDKGIKNLWDKLDYLVLKNDINKHVSFGFFHDIPLILPLEECMYTAGIAPLSENIDLSLPKFILPNNICAKFTYKGVYEDFYDFINWVHFDWLLKSGYETTPNPSFAIYEDSDFYNKKEVSIEYYLPIEI
jgi:AraC family transcriptional regulator